MDVFVANLEVNHLDDRLQYIIEISVLEGVDRVFILGSDKHDQSKRLVLKPFLG